MTIPEITVEEHIAQKQDRDEPASSNGGGPSKTKARTNAMSLVGKAILGFELSTAVALQLLAVVLIFVSTAVLFMLAIGGLRTQVGKIDTVSGLLSLVQRSIAGILVVVLGLEILETLKAFFRDHEVRLEVILVVAIIAVSRHLVQVDFEPTAPGQLIGLSCVVVALTLGYFLVKKALSTFRNP